MNTSKPASPHLAALWKQEQARDKNAAMQDYQAERLAVAAKTARLRAARLAKEAAARLTPASKKKPARRVAASKR